MRWRMSRRRIPRTIINSNTFGLLCTIIIGRSEYQCLFVFGVFPKSLIGEMEGKEREREEN